MPRTRSKSLSNRTMSRLGRPENWRHSPAIADASLDISLGGDRVIAMSEERHHVIDRPWVSRTDHDLVAFQRPLEDVPFPDVGRVPNLPRDDRQVPLRYFCPAWHVHSPYRTQVLKDCPEHIISRSDLGVGILTGFAHAGSGPSGVVSHAVRGPEGEGLPRRRPRRRQDVADPAVRPRRVRGPLPDDPRRQGDEEGPADPHGGPGCRRAHGPDDL